MLQIIPNQEYLLTRNRNHGLGDNSTHEELGDPKKILHFIFPLF